jgi:flagellar biosynthesis/type III secretory pathway chaperone
MLPSPDIYYKKIGSLINLQVRTARELHAAMKKQHNALRENDISLINQAIELLQSLSQQLETLDRKRAYLIQSLGFNNTPEGMDDCFQWCDHSGQLKKMWKNLLTISKNCQQQNLSNAATTQLKYRHAGRAMNILQGSRRNSETYNTKGQSHRHASPNKLASA